MLVKASAVCLTLNVMCLAFSRYFAGAVWGVRMRRVVMGNCFSLQKEHETAQKFFSRALQLDQNLAYAHTLCGHEYFANEDFEKGLACFQDAIKIDPRHYNAWCSPRSSGMVFLPHIAAPFSDLAVVRKHGVQRAK